MTFIDEIQVVYGWEIWFNSAKIWTANLVLKFGCKFRLLLVPKFKLNLDCIYPEIWALFDWKFGLFWAWKLLLIFEWKSEMWTDFWWKSWLFWPDNLGWLRFWPQIWTGFRLKRGLNWKEYVGCFGSKILGHFRENILTILGLEIWANFLLKTWPVQSLKLGLISGKQRGCFGFDNLDVLNFKI